MQKAEISTQNQTSMEMLFKEHYASMYRLAFTLLRDGESSRDVVQSVLFEVDERFSDFARAFCAWLFVDERAQWMPQSDGSQEVG
jgi:DNA-directed RNA polymerase specialized sigma24 family protein